MGNLVFHPPLKAPSVLLPLALAASGAEQAQHEESSHIQTYIARPLNSILYSITQGPYRPVLYYSFLTPEPLGPWTTPSLGGRTRSLGKRESAFPLVFSFSICRLPTYRILFALLYKAEMLPWRHELNAAGSNHLSQDCYRYLGNCINMYVYELLRV